MTKQDRARRTRRKLVRSAAEAFDRAGFAEASIAGITARAGVSHGALHFHFRNKRALGEAVERVAARTLLHITGPVPLRHPAPLQHLVDVSHVLARRLVEDPVLRGGFSLGGDAAWRSGVSLWEQWHDWVQLMFTVARDQGALAPDAAVEDAVASVTAVLAGYRALSREGTEWLSEQTMTRFWRLTLPQLAGDAVESRPRPEGSAEVVRCAGRVPFDEDEAEEEPACGAA